MVSFVRDSSLQRVRDDDNLLHHLLDFVIVRDGCYCYGDCSDWVHYDSTGVDNALDENDDDYRDVVGVDDFVG